MAYNYFGTGSQVIGDLIAVVDPQLNTKIDFENDTINLITSGTTVLSVTNGAVAVTGTLNVSGTISGSKLSGDITSGLSANKIPTWDAANFKFVPAATISEDPATGTTTITGSGGLTVTGNTKFIPSGGGVNVTILVSGSNTVGGSTYIDFLRATNTSVGATTPSKTFRLNNSGSVEIVNNAYSSTIYTLTDAGDISNLGNLSVGGQTTLGTTSEKLTISSGGTGSVTYNTLANSVFYNSGPTGNITANFTNVPTTTAQATSVTVVVSQSATPKIIEAVQINSTSSTISWANKIIPSGTANQYDVFGFSLIRSGSTWITLGQMSTYG